MTEPVEHTPPERTTPARSPASRSARTIIASVFIAIWLLATLWDFFAVPDVDVIPLWFQATGLVVLGYLLGLSTEDLQPPFK